MAELTFNMQLGALVRGSVRRQLKAYCFQRGYKLDYDEDKGLLASLINVTILLPDSQLNQAQAEIMGWAEGLREDS